MRRDLAVPAEGRISAGRQSQPGHRHPAAAAGLQPRSAPGDGQHVEEGLGRIGTSIPTIPKAKELDAPPIEDFFFVARNRQVFVGVRSADPTRAAELVPVIQRLGDKLPGTILVAKQTSLFEQGLTAGRTVDIEITGPDIKKLVALGGRIFGQLNGTAPDKPGLLPDVAGLPAAPASTFRIPKSGSCPSSIRRPTCS